MPIGHLYCKVLLTVRFLALCSSHDQHKAVPAALVKNSAGCLDWAHVILTNAHFTVMTLEKLLRDSQKVTA